MTPTIYYSDEWVTLWHGRCEDVLPMLEQVDHVITDPPYSEHVHGKNRRGSSLRRVGVVSEGRELGFDSLSPELMRFCAGEFARLARRWTLVFCDVESSSDWRVAATDAGSEYVRTGIWVKLGSTPQFTGDRPAPGFEAIVITHPSGRKRWNGGGAHAVWTHAIVSAGSNKDARLHTTQKPLGLMKRLVSLFTDEGDTILDCFAGSSTLGVAAALLGRKAVLVEAKEEYCEVSAKRLEQVQAQTVMNFGALT